MTALANLPEDDDGMPIGYADWYNRRFFGQPVNTARDHDCETAWRAGALHARAALSPAELGGVADFDKWYGGCDARLWNNWDACKAAYIAGQRSTPRADEAVVDDAMVERALSAMPIDVWNCDGADYMRAALTAALNGGGHDL